MSRTTKKRPPNAYQSVVDRAHNAGAPRERFITNVAGGVVEADFSKLMIRATPIMFGIPFDETLYAKFFTIFIKNLNMMPWDGFISTESTYLPDARNQIHNVYVEQSNLPYLFMLDSDVLCPPHIVERLMSHDLPIVGGWYKNKKQGKGMTNHPIVYDFVSETEYLNWRHREVPGSGLERVDGMGAGCWLMKREVAVALGKSPYSMEKGTEDLVLSKKLMDLGIPLHVDWELACAHLGVSYV